MSNALIKKQLVVNGVDVTKDYIDNLFNTTALNDKENKIKLITKADYDKLSAEKKQDVLFLVVEAPKKISSEDYSLPIMTTINRASTDKTIPTSGAVYKAASNIEEGFKLEVVNILPDTSNAQSDVLYVYESSQYVLNEAGNGWIIIGNNVDMSDYLLKSSLLFKFAISDDGKYGYIKNETNEFVEF